MSLFTLVWSFRNRFECIQKSIITAHVNTPPHIPFLLVDANSTTDTINSVRDLATVAKREIRTVETHYRTSLCEAWNLGIMLSNTPYIIFASSDVEFTSPNWIDPIVYYAAAGMPYILLENHSVFAISRKLIKEIGWFDENFKNGPHFDCDFMLRASEANISVTVMMPTEGTQYTDKGYKHEDSSEVTVQRVSGEVKDRLPMNDKQNEIYFKKKWDSGWPGWPDKITPGEPLPHPPTNISLATRLLEEQDWHPSYRARY